MNLETLVLSLYTMSNLTPNHAQVGKALGGATQVFPARPSHHHASSPLRRCRVRCRVLRLLG